MWTPQMEQERRLNWAHSLELSIQEIRTQMYRARSVKLIKPELHKQLQTWAHNNVDNFQVTPESVAPLLDKLVLNDQSWGGLSQLIWYFTATFGAAAAQALMVEHPQFAYFDALVESRLTTQVWEIENANIDDAYVLRFNELGRTLIEKEMTHTVRGIYRKGWLPVYVNWERQFAIVEHR